MCYFEELFVQLDDKFVFVLVLRIPERLAWHILCTETGAALKVKLHSEIMRLLRGIAASGDENKHIHSKTFVYEITCRLSQWKKLIPQLQVGETTSSLMDKDYIVHVHLRENVIKDDEILHESSEMLKSLESPQTPTILEAASKKIDRSCCSAKSSDHATNNNDAVQVGKEFLACRRKRSAESPSKATAVEQEVEVGEEYSVRRRKRPANTPSKRVETRDSAVDVEVGEEYAVRRKKREKTSSLSSKTTQSPPSASKQYQKVNASSDTVSLEKNSSKQISTPQLNKSTSMATRSSATPKSAKSTMNSFAKSALVSSSAKKTTSPASVSQTSPKQSASSSEKGKGRARSASSRDEPAEGDFSSDEKQEPPAKQSKTAPSTPAQSSANTSSGIRSFFQSLLKF